MRTRLLRVAEASEDNTTGSTPDVSGQILGRHLQLSADQPHDILAWLRTVAMAARDTSVFGVQPTAPACKNFLLPKAQGAKPLEVVGIPLEAPGLYIVELESPQLGASLLGKPQSLFVPTAVLVTNLSVHFKWGRETSLIWVTTLDEGRAVPKARVAQEQVPTRVAIRHVGSDEQYELSLSWEDGRVAENTWVIPKGAKLGRYQVVLQRVAGQGAEGSGSDQEWTSGEFRVEKFRVPLMRGILQPPSELQIAVSELPVDVAVQYLAGGGASNLPVALRAQIRPKGVSFPADFEGFTFANGRVREGIVRRGSSSASGNDQDDNEPTTSASLPGRSGVHQRLDLVLDETGMARATITRLPKLDEPVDLLLELEYRDPNGEVQTTATTVPLWPTKLLVGLKTEAWVTSKNVIAMRVAVVDVHGYPMPGAPLQVDGWQRKFYSYRKRLVGGFYAYEHVEETRQLGELCRGVTDAQGLLRCEQTPPTDGNLIVQASLPDDAGGIAVAHQGVWMPGARPWWFDVQDHDRIDLLPEKRHYEPGEVARFQVRMPFREATALVTTEREGLLDGFVVPLSGHEPVIEVPVREDFAPNMFISVLAVRGRIGGVQPTAMVDLGRPSFKLCVAEVRVGWRKHELMVRVTSDRTIYRVRTKALLRVAVRTADGLLPLDSLNPGSDDSVGPRPARA